MRRLILIVSFILLTVILCVAFGTERRLSTLSLGQTVISVEIADTDTDRIRGLGGREAIAPSEGMLFVFPEPGRQGIWMKEMLFPLDIMWLQDSIPFNSPFERVKGERVLRVIDVEENATPDTYPKVFLPDEEASYVLEMRGGAAKQSGIGTGSLLTFRP